MTFTTAEQFLKDTDTVDTVPRCSDCPKPAIVTEQELPLCGLHAYILMDRGVEDPTICMSCLMRYDGAKWNVCPNDGCITNDPEYYDFDGPEPEDDEPWLPNGESI